MLPPTTRIFCEDITGYTIKTRFDLKFDMIILYYISVKCLQSKIKVYNLIFSYTCSTLG